jgi:ABC-type transport system involved in Fe-S cluster assembly fused permease/ATPase subunit
MGLVGALRSYAWIPIGQYSYRELSTRAFAHVQSLSLDFHIAKKTGEVMSALSKGSAINSFLEQILFQIFPVLVDLVLVLTLLEGLTLGMRLLLRVLRCVFCVDCTCGYVIVYFCDHQNHRLEDWIEKGYGC